MAFYPIPSQIPGYLINATSGAVQIIKVNDDHSLSLCGNNLSTILESPDVKDKEVVVVSVVGEEYLLLQP